MSPSRREFMNATALTGIGLAVAPLVGSVDAAAAEDSASSAGAISGDALIAGVAPKRLAQVLIKRAPIRLVRNSQNIDVQLLSIGPGKLRGSVSPDLTIQVDYEYLPDVNVLRWITRLRNTSSQPVENIEITPLAIPMNFVPERDYPRVRHLTGSFHFDAAYPPRAFRIQEERIMTHDHAKPIRIGSGSGASAYEHSPELQFAIGAYGSLAGFYVAFEWSSRWFLEATWASYSVTGEPTPEFLVQGNVGLGKLTLAAGEEIVLPRVHIGFWEGTEWSAADYAMRRYLREALGARLNGKVPVPPVSYDHWFGIYLSFDVEDLKRQADRAAELGVEYFVLDAAWYPVKERFRDGLGNWIADPKKFPHGIEELSEHVRRLGMGFGIWHWIELATPGTPAPKDNPHLYHNGMHLRLDLQEGQEFALARVRQWIRDWKLTWIRWELSDPDTWIYELDPSGKRAIAYINGLYRIIDAIRDEQPDLYIEGCQGGGTRMDWGLAARTHGTWLSDHTADPDVVRFMQTGASRFWPAHFLNMAVRVPRKSGDAEVHPHNLLSRMVGALSFGGDIAQWSRGATRQAAHYVATYKGFRELLNGGVQFPLEQPRSDRDWDIVLLGEPGKRRLLFAFRMEGPDHATVKLPRGAWKRILGSETAALDVEDGAATLRLDRNSSALWGVEP